MHIHMHAHTLPPKHPFTLPPLPLHPSTTHLTRYEDSMQAAAVERAAIRAAERQRAESDAELCRQAEIKAGTPDINHTLILAIAGTPDIMKHPKFNPRS